MRKTAVEITHFHFLSNKFPAANLQRRKLTISLIQSVQFFRRLQKLRKETIISVMSIRLSVRPHGTIRRPMDRFS
jgi:hypothetical protein